MSLVPGRPALTLLRNRAAVLKLALFSLRSAEFARRSPVSPVMSQPRQKSDRVPLVGTLAACVGFLLGRMIPLCSIKSSARLSFSRGQRTLDDAVMLRG
jgi:MFS-type transporter involved in bile tolerance (Atg22 family)